MTLLLRYRTLFTSILQEKGHEQLAITIFCKSLYAFLFLKILFLWPVLPDVLQYLPYEFRSSLHSFIYAPIKLAQYDLNAFLVLMLLLLLLALIVRVNYFTSALIFWLSFSLSRFALPNGSDYVLNLFLFLSIFLSVTPAFKSEALRSTQYSISNFTFLFCRIQFSLIYLLSGFDKLISHAWRTGEAVYSIANLDYYFNPRLTIPFNEALYIVIAWSIVLFELGFPILIWFKRFRLYALAMGIIFHLSIIFILSLPDFGVVMLLTYSLFIPFRSNRERVYESSLR
jgi:hypothetical protein